MLVTRLRPCTRHYFSRTLVSRVSFGPCLFVSFQELFGSNLGALQSQSHTSMDTHSPSCLDCDHSQSVNTRGSHCKRTYSSTSTDREFIRWWIRTEWLNLRYQRVQPFNMLLAAVDFQRILHGWGGQQGLIFHSRGG